MLVAALCFQGPPLNDSRLNRVMGARAVDHRLDAPVGAPQPWLSVTLMGLEDTAMFVSETRECTLRLTNLGLEPLRSLAIQRHRNSILVCGREGVGSEGLDPAWIRVSLPEGGIAVGASMDVPLCVQPVRDGKQYLTMTLKYSAEEVRNVRAEMDRTTT